MKGMSENSDKPKKLTWRIAFATAVALLAFGVHEGRIRRQSALIVCVSAAIVFMTYQGCCKFKGRTSFNPEDDDDDGIDWREKGDEDLTYETRDGWAVLIGDCAVFEADEVAERLDNAGIRCRLEIVHEDRALHISGGTVLGNGGLGTRMRVLVPPGEYDSAMRVMGKIPEECVS